MQYKDWPSGRILFSIVCILSIGIIIAGILHYRIYKRNQRIEIESKLHTIAELKTQDLIQWREERISDGEYFRQNPYLSILLSQIWAKPADTSLKMQLQGWLNFINNHSLQYDCVAIVSSSGKELYAAPQTAPAPLSGIPSMYFKEYSGKTRVVDFYRNDRNHKIYLALLVPLRNFATDENIGTLLLRIDPETYLYPYIQRWPAPDVTSETLLVRREGSDAVMLTGLKYHRNMALKYRIPLSYQDRPAVRAVLGYAGYVEGMDYRNIPVVAYVNAIPNSPWFLIARMDKEEAFAVVRQRLWEVITVSLTLLGMAWMGVGFFWRRHREQYYIEKVAAAESLHRQEEFSRVLLENITDGVIACDAGMNVVLFNRLAREWHGTEGINTSASSWGAYYNLFDADGMHPLKKSENPLICAFESGVCGPVAMSIKAQGRPIRFVMASGSAFYDNAGNKIGAVIVLRDITALRESMEELQSSLREKEALLREIHHRVKNNLQVISSLLSLEAARIENPGTQMTLRDMRNRIRSMALLHETIYSSKSLARVELSVYLDRLCRHLFHSLLAQPELIQLEMAIAPLFLDVSQAVPCGLLINELLSNSLKHAFPDGRRGIIRVEVSSMPANDSICVRVKDNGIGLPEDFEQRRSRSLGLQLVADLAGQLGGMLDVASNPGAAFTVIFKPKTGFQSELHNG